MAPFGDGFGDGFGGSGQNPVVALSYAAFFLGTKRSVVELDTIEIQHPAFSQTFRLTPSATRGIVVERLSAAEAAGSYAFAYCPMRVTALGSVDTLGAGYRIELGDLGEKLPQELDRVAAEDAFDVEPVVLYRAYRSDDLSAPMCGPVRLEVQDFGFTRTGAAFEAKAPSLNVATTGDVYSVARLPSLRGFVS